MSPAWCEVARYLLVSGIVVAVVFVAAWLMSSWMAAVPRRLKMGLQIAGAFVTFWAGYAKVGWSIQTFNGSTPPEMFNEWFFRVATGVGMFVLVLSTFLEAKD